MFKYESKIGSGSYGRVYSASKDEKLYAIKRNLVCSKLDFMGSIKELDLLHKFKIIGSEYLSQCTHYSFVPPFDTPLSPISKELRDDNVYFVFPKMTMNLHHFIVKKYSINQIKWLMLNILMGVESLHFNQIVHLDLKPTNILVSVDETHHNLSAVVADFGMSKFLTQQVDQTGLAITSWYRAPEMCDEDAIHQLPCDIWSLGCIFYELAFRQVLFKSKLDESDHVNVLKTIVSFYPNLLEADLNWVLNRFKSPEKYKDIYTEKNKNSSWFSRINSKTIDHFEEKIGRFDLFQDLLSRMLTFNPEKRLTIKQCLDHPFFSNYSDCIILTRCNYLIPVGQLHYSIAPVKDRELITKYVKTIYENKKGLAWYTPQILIHTLEIYDRYLAYEYNRLTDKAGNKLAIIDAIEEDRLVKFNTSLYLSIKYFQHDIRFGLNTLLSNADKTVIQKAEQFESYLIKRVLQYNIFIWTVFEYPDTQRFKWKDSQIKTLILNYSEIIKPIFHPQKNAASLLEFYYENL